MLRGIYNLYEDGELVLENVFAEDIREYLGVDKLHVANYAEQGITYVGRYKFVKADETLARSKFAREWEEAVAPFKRVTWVKSGGRKLGGY